MENNLNTSHGEVEKCNLTELHVMRLYTIDNLIKNRNLADKRMVEYWDNILIKIDMKINEYIIELIK